MAETVLEALRVTERSRDVRVRATVLSAACGLAPLADWNYEELALAQLAASRQLGDRFLEVIGLVALTWSGLFTGTDRSADVKEALRIANEAWGTRQPFWWRSKPMRSPPLTRIPWPPSKCSMR